MSTLRIRLQPSMYNMKLELGAIANIYDITGESKHAKKTLRDQIIQDITDIQLDPGKYLVEAILPSGETSYNEVTLTDPHDYQELLIGSRSRHEWLTMQHFVGDTRRKAIRYDAIFTKQYLPEQFSSEVISFESYLDFDSSWAVFDRYLRKSESGHQLSSSTSLTTLRDYLPATSVHNFHPAFYDQNDSLFEFNSEILSGSRQYYLVNYLVPRFKRYFLIVNANNLTQLCCVLPVPWAQDDHELTIQALVHLPASISTSTSRERGFHDELTVSIAVPDRRVGAVIGYLGSGMLPTAEKLLKTATSMLYDKIVNPIAAAAGAYVMVFAEQSRERDEWHDWVENLMNWFPWLPDGAIMHAWLKLTYGNKDSDLLKARNSLLEGYRRGIPFYSKGVKMLMDGLTLIANDANHTDAEIEGALKVVRRVAMNTNMRQPFTTVTL